MPDQRLQRSASYASVTLLSQPCNAIANFPDELLELRNRHCAPAAVSFSCISAESKLVLDEVLGVLISSLEITEVIREQCELFQRRNRLW